MSDFKKPSRFSGGAHKSFNRGGSSRPSFGGRPGAGRSFDSSKELFEAECSNCHKMCQVPFRPNGKKPVFCANCFQKDDDRAPRGQYEKREFSSPRSFNTPAPRTEDRRIDDIKRQLDTMNSTLERILSAIEKSNRAGSLTEEVSKHIETEKPAKKVVVKKAQKKVSKR